MNNNSFCHYCGPGYQYGDDGCKHKPPNESKQVWCVRYDCGDYYCTGEHLYGIFSTEEKANAAAEELMKVKKTSSHGSVYETGTFGWTLDTTEEQPND